MDAMLKVAVNLVGNVKGDARPCTQVLHERQVTLESHALV